MEQALEELKGYARDVLTAMFPDAVEVEEATPLMSVLETLSLTSKDETATRDESQAKMAGLCMENHVKPRHLLFLRGMRSTTALPFSEDGDGAISRACLLSWSSHRREIPFDCF